MKKITTILLVILTLSILNIRSSIAQAIPQDAGVAQILNIHSITDLAIIPLNVRVKNYGTSPITSVDILYDVNGSANILTYTTAIAVGDSAFVSLGNISISPGLNSICVKTVLMGDTNYYNDQECINTFRQAIYNLTFTDDFETLDLWMPDTLPNQWERGIPAMSNINIAHSPINVWAIGLDTNYDNNSMEYLYTPKFNTIGIDSTTLKFWHFYQTETGQDGGYIQYRRNSGFWISLGYIGDPRGNNWYNNAMYGMNKFSGNSNGWIESTYFFDFTNGEFANTDTIQLRYVFSSNGNTNDSNGWAIDDFSFELPLVANDVGVTAIVSPSDSVQNGSHIAVSVKIKNFGTATQNTFDLWYQIGSSSIYTETVLAPAGGLIAGDSMIYDFVQLAPPQFSNFSICAGTSLPSDCYPQNDDYCSSNIIVTPTNIDAGVISIDINSGGLPYLSTVTAEIKNYGLNTLTSFNVEYSINNGYSWITEPWTGNLTSNNVDTFVFATPYNTPLGNYSVCVQSVVPNDTIIINDMRCIPANSISDIGVTNILSPNNSVQTGDTIEIKVEVKNYGIGNQSSFDIWYQIGSQTIITETFTPLGGLLADSSKIFTFNTTSIAPSTNFTICSGTILANDVNTQNDDYCSSNIIVTPAAFDAGIISLDIIEDNSGGILTPLALKAEIKNFGINTLTSFNVEYSIDNGNSWTTEPWTGNLATNEVDTFIFNTPFNQPLGHIYNICVITDLTNDDYTVNDMLCNTIVIDAINDANSPIFKVDQSYPNPAFGNVSINYIVPTNGDINFELRNTLGQVIYSSKQASFTGKNTIEVDTDKLATGVYYYSVVFDGQRITSKMIVNK